MSKFERSQAKSRNCATVSWWWSAKRTHHRAIQDTPLPNMVYSPLNLVPKAGNEGKFWLIHDLSYPYNNQSVNACIPQENVLVKYQSVDDVIDMALEIGMPTVAFCFDIRSAFRNLPLSVLVIFVLGFTFNGLIYINISMPFGAASSCAIFEKVANILQWIVINETKAQWILHYLDNYILLAKCLSDLCILMKQFNQIIACIDMPITHEKTLGPSEIIEFLGLVLNFLQQLIQILEKKRKNCLAQLDQLLNLHFHCKKVTVWQIQKLAGHLNFLCQALLAGHPYLASLYALTATPPGSYKVARAGHQRRLKKETVEDLMMFRSFLLESAHQYMKTVPFLVWKKVFDEQLQLSADAAGSFFLGFGCIFQDQWAQGLWQETTIFDHAKKPNIALLELFSIVMAIKIWAECLSGKSIILRSDNSATVVWINQKKSPIPAAMNLIRHLTKTCLHFQVVVLAWHLPGHFNEK